MTLREPVFFSLRNSLIALTVLVFIAILFLWSGEVQGMTISVESPVLYDGRTEEINITYDPDADLDVHVVVSEGRAEYGGQVLDEYNLTLRQDEETTVSSTFEPHIGENTLFVNVNKRDDGTFIQEYNITLDAGADYSDVLLIINNNSAVSDEIGNYFLEHHDPHVCFVDAPAKETITRTEFDDLRSQIEEYLNTNDLFDSINYIVTTKGVPLRVSGEGNAAVDSELTLILGQYASDIGGSSYRVNPFFSSGAGFSRETYGIYLVTRLTGYTTEDVKALIDRSIEASTLESAVNLSQGKVYLDVDPGRDGGSYEIGNDWIRNAASILDAFGYDVYLDSNNTFLRHKENVSMYASWGSNDGHDFLPHGTNTGMETDSDTDDVPDDWTIETGVSVVDRTGEDTNGGSWAVRVVRDDVDGSRMSIMQNFTPAAGWRYYLRGYVNLSGVGGTGGVKLQIRYIDSEGDVFYTVNGSFRRGTTSDWVMLSPCILESMEFIDGSEDSRGKGANHARNGNNDSIELHHVSFGIVIEDCDGTIYIDDIQLVEIVPGNDYLLGALAETIVSTSARSFTYPTSYGQSLIADIIRSGVTGVKGYCYEPYLDAISHPDLLFPVYATGGNLAEAYYSGSIKLSWMDVVVGDPKLAPLALLPNLVLDSPTIITDANDTVQQCMTTRVWNSASSISQDWNLHISITGFENNSTYLWNLTMEGMQLYPGESIELSFNWTAPEPGTYVMKLNILPDLGQEEKGSFQWFKEMRIDDNSYNDTFRVPHPPDLIVEEMTTDPDVMLENTTFTLTAHIYNSGEVDVEVNVTLLVNEVSIETKTIHVLGLSSSYPGFDLNLPAGSYTIRIIVDPENNTRETNESNNLLDRILRVNAIPVPITDDEHITRSGIAVYFNGSASYDPDGNISFSSWTIAGYEFVGLEVSHTFGTRGNHTVVFMVRDNDGVEVRTNVTVVVLNSEPVPFILMPDTVLSLELFSLDARFSYDNDSDIMDYLWDLGDGNTSNEKVITHTYSRPGEYTVTLMIWDDVGAFGTMQRKIVVINRFPNARLSVLYKDKLYPWQSIPSIDFKTHSDMIFQLNSSFDPDGTVVLIGLDLGDGMYISSESTEPVMHSYNSSGDYMVSLMITDDHGDSSFLNFTLSVTNDPPIALFHYNPDEPTSYQWVTFESLSTDIGYIVKYQWMVDSEIYDAGEDGYELRYAFHSYGFHSVKLTVWDDEGMSAMYYDDRIFIYDIPADISSADYSCEKGDTIRIHWNATDRDGGISHYMITLPDGSRKETKTQYVDHTFTDAGTFEVMITVVDDNGLTNTTAVTVTVDDKEEGSFIPIPAGITMISILIGVILTVTGKWKKGRRFGYY